MIRVLLVACALAIAGCQSAPAERRPSQAGETVNGLAVRGGDGSSIAMAVEIMAKTASEGVPAEYAWIRMKFPGAKPSGTELIASRGKYYDAIHFISAEGKEVTVYFDISKYMGKL